ncbi:MAG TPA: DUF2254 family protein, partial [Chloroflexaceae bacterium]|nr:DUF2254 family protein [Chloroflexaceae bacterium]
ELMIRFCRLAAVALLAVALGFAPGGGQEKSVKPGINDPFTAVTCLDRLGAMLCRVARRPLPDGRRYDDEGRLRVVAEPIRFDELVDGAFDQIRVYGRDNLVVMGRLFDTLGRVGAATEAEWRRAPLLRQARLAYEGSREALPTDGDRQTLEERYQATLATLNSEARALGKPD